MEKNAQERERLPDAPSSRPETEEMSDRSNRAATGRSGCETDNPSRDSKSAPRKSVANDLLMSVVTEHPSDVMSGLALSKVNARQPNVATGHLNDGMSVHLQNTANALRPDVVRDRQLSGATGRPIVGVSRHRPGQAGGLRPNAANDRRESVENSLPTSVSNDDPRTSMRTSRTVDVPRGHFPDSPLKKPLGAIHCR